MLGRLSNVSISQKGLILVAVPVILSSLFLCTLYILLEVAKDEAHRARRAKEAYSAVAQSGAAVVDAISAFTAYAYTRSASSRQHLEDCEAKAQADCDAALRLYNKEKEKTKVLLQMRNLEKRAFLILNVAKEQIDEGGDSQDSILHLSSMRHQMQDTLSQLSHTQGLLLAGERSPPDPSSVLLGWSNRVQLILAIGFLSSISICLWLSAYFTRSIASRLAITTDNTLRLAEKSALNPPLEGVDEIARLDKAFHQMANLLEEASRKERAVIAYASDVICSLDSGHNFLTVSPAARTVWGYEPAELNAQSLMSYIEESDRAQVVQYIQESIENEVSVSFEARFRRMTGEFIYTLWSAHWSAAEKNLFCVCHDISARKLAEEVLRQNEARIRLIIESMPVALTVLDESGYIELSNGATETMFDTDARRVIGQHIGKLFASRDKLELLDQAIGHVIEMEAVKETGAIFPVELSFNEFQSTEGPKRLAIMLDISERREMERMKREFVAMVSHDLRTPLSSFRSVLALLQVGSLGPLSEKGLQLVAKADSEISRLIALINDLLDAEKMSSGQFDINLGKVRIAEVLSDSVEAVRLLAEERNIVIEVSAPPITITADGARLVQVLVNLLSNSIKFSPKASTIKIGVFDAGVNTEVRITDQGCGIPAEYHALIFEKFRQVKSSDATRKGGTGLGLAISKAIVEAHGGQIGVESKEGVGSTFWFTLPNVLPLTVGDSC